MAFYSPGRNVPGRAGPINRAVAPGVAGGGLGIGGGLPHPDAEQMRNRPPVSSGFPGSKGWLEGRESAQRIMENYGDSLPMWNMNQGYGNRLSNEDMQFGMQHGMFGKGNKYLPWARGGRGDRRRGPGGLWGSIGPGGWMGPGGRTWGGLDSKKYKRPERGEDGWMGEYPGDGMMDDQMMADYEEWRGELEIDPWTGEPINGSEEDYWNYLKKQRAQEIKPIKGGRWY